MWSFWWSWSIHLFGRFSNIITSQSRGRCGAFGGVGQYTCLVGFSNIITSQSRGRCGAFGGVGQYTCLVGLATSERESLEKMETGSASTNICRPV